MTRKEIESLKHALKRTYFCWFFIIFYLIYIILVYGIFKFNKMEIYFDILLILILIIYLFFVKRIDLLKNSFNRDDGKSQFIVTMIFIIILLPLTAIKVGGFIPVNPIFSLDRLVQTLEEELVFRAFLLGVFIEQIPLLRFKSLFKINLPIYIPDKEERWKNLIFSILLVSIIFSAYHLDWLVFKERLFFRSVGGIFFALAFVLTNKKIYSPVVIHYMFNTYVPPD